MKFITIMWILILIISSLCMSGCFSNDDEIINNEIYRTAQEDDIELLIQLDNDEIIINETEINAELIIHNNQNETLIIPKNGTFYLFCVSDKNGTKVFFDLAISLELIDHTVKPGNNSLTVINLNERIKGPFSSNSYIKDRCVGEYAIFFKIEEFRSDYAYFEIRK